MNPGSDLHALLERKRALAAHASASPGLAQRLRELSAWQATRLASTYDDLRREPAFAQAVEFFLTDLYGPQDFSRRDSDLARAMSVLKRTLPQPALKMLRRAIELQVLSAELDQAMIAHLPPGPVTAATYAAAYRALGRPGDRRLQIDLITGIGADLNRIVQHRWIGVALRAAHAPAHAAGFGALQNFIERGFAGFRQMQGSTRLLQAIDVRETRLMEELLRGSDALLSTGT